MRLRRLDLVRYGKFTDFSIDFGERRPDRPDLHVIYGANEAGKSTMLQAWLDLLFGIEVQSPYGFLHGYRNMRIGGLIETAGATGEVQARAFARIKQAANTLRDHQDQPIPEEALRGGFGNLTRESYCQMFSLDDDTLEQGGEEILTSRGELGQLLFAASAGLSGLSGRMKQAQEEAEALYRKGGSKNLIAERKRQLAELAERRKALDVAALEYRELKAQAARAAAEHDAAEAERRDIAARIAEAGRRKAAFPRFRALVEARRELSALTHLQQAPPEIAGRHAALGAKGTLLEGRRKPLEAGITRLREQIAGVAPDEAVLAVSAEIDALVDPGSRYKTAALDLPKRVAELEDLETRIAGQLRRIGRPAEAEPARLLLPEATAARLRTLLGEWSGVVEKLATARAERDDAAGKAAEAEARLAEAGEGEAPTPDRLALLDGLAAAVARLRAGDPAERRRLAAQGRERAAELLARRLDALSPWRGAAEELAALALPAVERFGAERKRIEDTAAEIARALADQESRQAEIARCEAEIAAIAGIDGLVTDQEAQKLRDVRDAAWAAHRRALESGSADRFEAAMRQDDRATAVRLAHGAGRGRLQALAKQRDLALAGQRAAARRIDALRHDEAKLRADLLRAVPPELAALPPAEIEDWLRRRAAALEAGDALGEEMRALREIEAEQAEHRGRLSDLLSSVGLSAPETASADTLFAKLEGLSRHEAEMKALRRAAAEARRHSERRRSEAAAAEERHVAWNAAFRAACGETWLVEGDGVPAAAEVQAILPALGDLGGLVEKKRELGHRIAAMRQDQAEFSALVAALARRLGMASGAEVDADAALIAARLASANKRRTQRDTLQSELDEAFAARKLLLDEIAEHGADVNEHLGALGASDLDEAQRVVDALVRRETLLAAASQAESEVLEALRIDDIAIAEKLFAAGDPHVWALEDADLERRREAQEGLCSDLLLARDAAQRAVDAVGADAEVARIDEERRTIRLEIEEAATRYLRLRAGMLATEQALRLYRERHRSAMLNRASEAFSIISRGAYRALATQPDNKGERLIAIGADGASKEAADLSKGTRFQLYLALRVAGYEEFASARPPVPFIADDIMETFDEMRAEEAFRLLGGMGRSGQVIYLTHHRHLCDIARDIVPGVTVHAI